MIRPITIAATALFWLGVGWIAWDAARTGDTAASAPATPAAPAASAGTARPITQAELARHARADDCWLAIDGAIYDVSAYLPLHPSEPEVLTAWCGKEASTAYHSKGQPAPGRDHSQRADSLLPRYRIGTLGAPR